MSSSTELQAPTHGTVTGGTWAKTVRASIHMLRTPRAWAVDLSDLDAAERCGATVVCIRDSETGRVFWATTATVRRYGFRLERGHGPQVALCLGHWRPTRAEAEAAGEGPHQQTAGGARQLALFEAAGG